MLLTADWHLTDRLEDLYRWDVFKTLRDIIARTNDHNLYILGDITDRKDRHSAALVNRLVEEIAKIDAHITILMGNHDMPLRGMPFWAFLSRIHKDVQFIDAPTTIDAHGSDDLLLLPYSPDPQRDWAKIDFKHPSCCFMHQTVSGVVTDSGRTLTNDKMIIFPRGLKVYSGDIHTPQVVGRVTYVGAPHPVNFGDTYPCRVLRLDRAFDIKEVITLNTTQKHVIKISSVADLLDWKINAGDYVKIRVDMNVNRLEQWPADQEEIARWATANGVIVSSTEVLVEDSRATMVEKNLPLNDPETIIRAFALAENLDGPMLDAGLAIMHKEKGT